MIEFNPDGSIKLPDHLEKNKQEKADKLRNQKSMLIRKEIVSDKTPKKCQLKLRLSEAFDRNDFVTNIFTFFNSAKELHHKLKKINEKEFEVEIGSGFRRCTECNQLISRYREHLYGNLILENGSCTYNMHKKDFCYEDYFT